MATKKTPDEYTLLRAMILKGEVMPNERLIEAEYAERLGTNRANIRKAFARLEQDGLVASEPFKGTHVRRITEVEAVEIFEVRGAIETLLIRQTVERLTEEDEVILKSLVGKMHEKLAKQDAHGVGFSSRALREEMWRIAGHSVGARLLTTLNSQLVRVWFQAITMPGRAEAIVVELEAVAEAVISGSPDKAVKAMKRYHDSSIAALKKAIRSRMS
jgi:DNA-binding GntR family transcriptional regulator